MLEEYFNISKLYILSHYLDQICCYRSNNAYNILRFKNMHKYVLKKYNDQTNKKKDFLEQLAWHNNYCINILTINDIIFHKYAKKQMVYKSSIKATTFCTIQDFIILLAIRITPNFHDIQHNQSIYLNPKYWCFASQLLTLSKFCNLMPMLAAFVREMHRV